MKYIDLEYNTAFEAYASADFLTSIGFEVTKPIEIDGVFCFQVETV